MKLKTTLRRTALIFTFAFLFHQNSNAQCFEIESILVDACDGNTNTEGLNEMVRFKVGNAPLNTSNLVVVWPNNPWGGLIQNAAATAKVANLNADILDAGGCGQLIQNENLSWKPLNLAETNRRTHFLSSICAC